MTTSAKEQAFVPEVIPFKPPHQDVDLEHKITKIRPFLKPAKFEPPVRSLVDDELLKQKFLAQAGISFGQTIQRFLNSVLYPSDGPHLLEKLGARLAILEAAFKKAAAAPSDQNKLVHAIDAAKAYCFALNQSAALIQEARQNVQNQLAQDVMALNAALLRVAKSNELTQSAKSRELANERNGNLQEIGDLVGIECVARNSGKVAIFSMAGMCLLDGISPRFRFDAKEISYRFSGLTVNGIPLSPEAVQKNFQNGKIGAGFAIASQEGQMIADALDDLAQDIITRFQDADIDHTVPKHGPAMFTDAGTRYQRANKKGLARRITLNAALDISCGGLAFRLRDGLGASAPTSEPQTAILRSLRDTLTQGRWKAGPNIVPALQKIDEIRTVIQTVENNTSQALCFAASQMCELQTWKPTEQSGNVHQLELAIKASELVSQELQQIMQAT